jgi:endo-1,4-beta-D-glucanase Y
MKKYTYMSIFVFFILISLNAQQMPDKDAKLKTVYPKETRNKPVLPAKGAFFTDTYRNMFVEAGYNRQEVDDKLQLIWKQLFYGDNQSQRVYYPVGNDKAYIFDTGNEDVRSEGMSYGMMICVQMNKQEEFNRLWKWAKTYMQLQSGPQKGYFAWQMDMNGNVMDYNTASDGEEYIVTALFFAANRWGNGEGIFNYSKEANEILTLAMNKENGNKGKITNLFNIKEQQVVFVPSVGNNHFTDPSYHLPAFYELWSLWADSNKSFWKKAAVKSRGMFVRFANPTTGLMPDYANFDGSPEARGGHADFKYDAWRCIMNMSVDYAWFKKDLVEPIQINRLLQFFAGKGISTYGGLYKLDGTDIRSDHSVGLVGCNATGALACKDQLAWKFVDDFYTRSIPQGKYRYYDGLLYFMNYLHLSGNFKIYKPQ